MDNKNPFENDIYENKIFNIEENPILNNNENISLNNDNDSSSNNKKNLQFLDKKMFCINCGKNGHISKKCLCPIISIGIICVKFNIEDIDLNTIINYSKKIQNKYLFSIDEIIKLVFDKPYNYLFINTDSQRMFKSFDEIIFSDI